MRVKGDDVIFSSGKIVYAHLGIIGLAAPEDGMWDISEGYDGTLYADDREYSKTNDLTKEEKVDLADYMIALWKRFKEETK